MERDDMKTEQLGIRVEQLIDELGKAGKNCLKIRKVCQAQIRYYQNNYSPKTIKGYLTAARRRIKQQLHPEHPALWMPLFDKCRHCNYSLIPYRPLDRGKCPECGKAVQKALTLPLEEMQQIKSDWKKEVSTKVKAKNRIKISVKQYLEACEKLVEDAKKSRGYLKPALALAAITGRRINSEILVSGAFFAPEKTAVIFSGQAKNRGKTPPYRINTLADAETVYELWKTLCEKKPFVDDDTDEDLMLVVKEAYDTEFKKNKRGDIIHCEHYEIFKLIDEQLIDLRKSVAFRCSKELSGLVKKYFDFIPGIKVKELRSVNALVTAWLNTEEDDGITDTRDMQDFCQEHLGHKELSDTRAYSKYKIVE